MDPYGFLMCTAGVLLLLGVILISFDHHLTKRNDDDMKYFLRYEMTPVIKDVVRDILSEGMDMIPEKLSEIRKNVEGGEE